MTVEFIPPNAGLIPAVAPVYSSGGEPPPGTELSWCSHQGMIGGLVSPHVTLPWRDLAISEHDFCQGLTDIKPGLSWLELTDQDPGGWDYLCSHMMLDT